MKMTQIYSGTYTKLKIFDTTCKTKEANDTPK